ncbi:MAG: bifunctional phosphoglucose/phosphomannose isomerase [Cyanobacteria bacterium RYN_339]|nr:bifunctional phosphoglucose/phosphomannose isomerase [Cyanobacteria bacterium RYN_339]
MLRIDDQDYMAGLDASGMLRFLADLPEAAQAAYDRGRAAKLPLTQPAQILICGMGGSAISGDLIRTQLLETCAVPVVVHRGDRLPKFAGPTTLAVFMSYSGNTGETLGCLRDAIQRGVPSVVVTGGGTAGELAAQHGFPVVAVQPGWQPRAALGDLFFALLGVVSQVANCTEPDVPGTVKHLRALRDRFAPGVPAATNPAKGLALAIQGKTPIIVGATPTTEAVALRWKCQFNENGKQTALYAVLPEMTHNDIVNMTATPHHQHVIVAIMDPADSAFVRRQREHALDIIGPHVAEVLEVKGEGESLLERQLTAIYLGDFVSVYLGFLNGVDPTPVDAIGVLKGRMANAEATS